MYSCSFFKRLNIVFVPSKADNCCTLYGKVQFFKKKIFPKIHFFLIQKNGKVMLTGT